MGFNQEYRLFPVPIFPESSRRHLLQTLLGNARVFNTIIIGVAAKHMDFEKEKWIEVVKKTVPPKTVDINVKAFLAGYEMG